MTGTLIGQGVDAFGGVSFSLAHPEPIQDKPRGNAMRDARHQAETLALDPVSGRPVPATMDVEPGTQTGSRPEIGCERAIE